MSSYFNNISNTINWAAQTIGSAAQAIGSGVGSLYPTVSRRSTQSAQKMLAALPAHRMLSAAKETPKLPLEIWAHIASFCEPEDLGRLQHVNKMWRALIQNIPALKDQVDDLTIQPNLRKLEYAYNRAPQGTLIDPSLPMNHCILVMMQRDGNIFAFSGLADSVTVYTYPHGNEAESAVDDDEYGVTLLDRLTHYLAERPHSAFFKLSLYKDHMKFECIDPVERARYSWEKNHAMNGYENEDDGEKNHAMNGYENEDDEIQAIEESQPTPEELEKIKTHMRRLAKAYVGSALQRRAFTSLSSS